MSQEIIISAVVGALVGAGVSEYFHRKYEKRSMKRETLRQFAGNRWMLTETSPLGAEVKKGILTPLNEIFIVFHDSPDVITALKKMHQELNQKNRLADNITTLTKEMCKSAGIKFDKLNDSFIETPFTPPR